MKLELNLAEMSHNERLAAAAAIASYSAVVTDRAAVTVDVFPGTPQPTVGQNGGSTEPALTSPAGDSAGNAATVTEKPKRTRKAAELKDDKVVVTKEPEAGNEPAATAASDSTAASTTEPAAPAAGSHSLDDVRAALQVYTEKHGMQKGIDLLKQYGANRISELATDQYGLFIEECKGA